MQTMRRPAMRHFSNIRILSLMTGIIIDTAACSLFQASAGRYQSAFSPFHRDRAPSLSGTHHRAVVVKYRPALFVMKSARRRGGLERCNVDRCTANDAMPICIYPSISAKMRHAGFLDDGISIRARFKAT